MPSFVRFLIFSLLFVLTTRMPAQNGEFGPYAVSSLGLVDLSPETPAALPPAMAGAVGSPAVLGFVFYPAVAGPGSASQLPFNQGSNVSESPAPGVFPMIVFQHGWAAIPQDYCNLLATLASWGFVVVAPVYLPIAPNGLPDFDAMNPATQALDSYALLHHVANLADQFPSFLLSGHIDTTQDARWGALGHSMGATANFYLSALDDRVETLVSLMPYVDTVNGQPAVPNISAGCTQPPTGLTGGAQAAQGLAESFKGNIFFLAGGADPFSPPQGVRWWFDRGPEGTGRPRHSLYVEVGGMGHFAATDATSNGVQVNFCGFPTFGTLSSADQSAWARRFVTTCFRAELGEGASDDENLFNALLAPDIALETVTMTSGVVQPIDYAVASYSEQPIAMARVSAGFLQIGVAKRDGDQAHLHLFVGSGQGYVQPVPFPNFDYLGFERLDPEIPTVLQLEASFASEGVTYVILPVMVSNLVVGAAWWMDRDGVFQASRLAKVIL